MWDKIATCTAVIGTIAVGAVLFAMAIMGPPRCDLSDHNVSDHVIDIMSQDDWDEQVANNRHQVCESAPFLAPAMGVDCVNK